MDRKLTQVIISNIYRNKNTIIKEQTGFEKYKQAGQSASKKRDSLEISSEAYELQNSDERMSATSGKDILGITRGDKANSFVIHFSDSAMVSRAVSRGYITVNGTDIPLSDEVKKQLTDINRQAQADRERAYYEYSMQHAIAVAEQQGEALKKAYEELSKAFEIAAKIASGGKVSSQEAELLMKTNPSLYAMALAASMMSEKNEKNDRGIDSTEQSTENSVNESMQEVSWSDFEWKSYETQMSVTMEETPEIEGVSEGEIILNSGK